MSLQLHLSWPGLAGTGFQFGDLEHTECVLFLELEFHDHFLSDVTILRHLLHDKQDVSETPTEYLSKCITN